MDEDQGERSEVIVKVEECDTGQVEMFTWTSTVRDGGKDVVTSPPGGLEVHSDGNATEMSSSDGSLSSHIMNPQCHHMHSYGSAALSQDLRSAAPWRTVSDMLLDDNGTGKFPHLPVHPPEHKERNSILGQKEPEPPQIKQEQEEEPQQEEETQQPPEEAAGSSLTSLAVKTEEDDENMTTSLAVKTEEDDENMTETEPVASTSTAHMKTQADVEDRGTSQPPSYCRPISSCSSDEDITEDSGDEWGESREGQSALNKLNSHKAQNVEGRRLSLRNKLSWGQKSSKQTPSTRSAPGKKSCTCTECGKVFRCTSYLRRHVRTGLKSKALKVLRRHRTGQRKTCSPRPSEEEEEEMEGKEDEDGTPRLSGVRSRVHTGEKPFQCSQCGKSFSLQCYLKTHQRVHSGEKPFQCSQCDKSFSQSESLKTHQRVHTGEKPFQCSHCDKSFSHLHNLKTHQRVHSGEKPFQCSQCGKSFSLQCNLKSHQRVHSGEKPFQCSQCGKSFSQQIHLMRHQRVHTGEKPFHCSQCNKSFSLQSNLKTHQRVHSGAKPFQCSQCDESFSQQSNLMRHQRVHSGEKPFQCSQCEKSFSHQCSLKGHQLVHTGEKPFQCSQCHKSFKQSRSLKRHLLIHTKGQTRPL